MRFFEKKQVQTFLNLESTK